MFKKIKKYFAKRAYQNRLEGVALEIIKTGSEIEKAPAIAAKIINDTDKIIESKFKAGK